MTITGAHMLLYTPEPEALRALLRELLPENVVDDGGGWLIYRLPPSELGVHPSGGSTSHQVCLMCDDIGATIDELRAKGVDFRGEPREESFGVTVTMLLPGGVEVLLYEPRHATAL
jgi:hypothetical protein